MEFLRVSLGTRALLQHQYLKLNVNVDGISNGICLLDLRQQLSVQGWEWSNFVCPKSKGGHVIPWCSLKSLSICPTNRYSNPLGNSFLWLISGICKLCPLCAVTEARNINFKVSDFKTSFSVGTSEDRWAMTGCTSQVDRLWAVGGECL